jgi:hypothetical protein
MSSPEKRIENVTTRSLAATDLRVWGIQSALWSKEVHCRFDDRPGLQFLPRKYPWSGAICGATFGATLYLNSVHPESILCNH